MYQQMIRERVLQEREAKREAKRQEKLFAEQQAQNDQFTSNSQVEAVNLQSDVDRQEATSNTKKAETQDQIQQNNEQVTTGESSVDGATNTSTGSPQDKIPQVNPLHDYAPYNYIITLSCIDKNTFNQGSSDEGIVIVKSGGKGVTGAPPLDKDFYIFTGSTVGVVPIIKKGIHSAKIEKLGSVKANII